MPIVHLGNATTLYSEILIHTRPPARNLEELKRNIRSYKNTVYMFELELKSLKWYNFIKKKDLKYKIEEYNKLILQEEYRMKLRKEDNVE